MIKVIEYIEDTVKENDHTYIVHIVKDVYVFGLKVYSSSKVRRV